MQSGEKKGDIYADNPEKGHLCVDNSIGYDFAIFIHTRGSTGSKQE